MFRFIKLKNKILFRHLHQRWTIFSIIYVGQKLKMWNYIFRRMFEKKYMYENINTYLIYSCNEKVVYEI